MAPRRLSESEKQDLVGRYKAGESTGALAEVRKWGAFGGSAFVWLRCFDDHPAEHYY